MRKVIVVSAHPDDEVLGAGGALLKHQANGDQIAWLIITGISTEYGFEEERVKSRENEIDKVSAMFGFSEVFKLNYPTMSLTPDKVNELIPHISSIFSLYMPEVIYVMNRSDAHSDHRYVFEAVIACTKSFRYPFIKSVLMYECISETEFSAPLPENVFIPNYYIDITNFLEKKLEIMRVYDSELGTHPFPRNLRNIEALATFRGATAGVTYAEAFQLVKHLDK